MKRLMISALAAASLLAGGCVLMQNSYVDNSEYDLELTRPSASAPKIRVGVFKNLSCSDRRFLIRMADGQLSASEYLRWRLAPELLLQRCMYGAFAVEPDSETSAPLLSAVIYRFEFDERDRSAHMSADFTLHGERWRTVRADFSEPVEDWNSGAAQAAAMNKCVKRAIAEINGALK